MDTHSPYAILRGLLQTTASFSGEEFLHKAASAFALHFAADFVFITRLMETPANTVQMLAAWRDGAEIAGWEFELPGTPCEMLYRKDSGNEWQAIRVGSAVGLAENVCRRFDSTKQTTYQAFIGVPLWDAHKKMMGHVALFFNRTLSDEDKCKTMLELVELFSLKVQAELNRMILEQARERMLQELKDVNSRLEHESITDPLTGLYNRRHFAQRIQEAFARFKRSADTFALILLDVDRFKSINDTYGHDAGDAVLCGLADALRGTTRSNIELCFRTGGEEFALLLLGHLTPKELAVVTDRIKHAVSKLDLPEKLNQLELTISIGASWPKAEDIGWNTVYVRTDHAMYMAKKAGGNRAQIDEEM